MLFGASMIVRKAGTHFSGSCSGCASLYTECRKKAGKIVGLPLRLRLICRTKGGEIEVADVPGGQAKRLSIRPEGMTWAEPAKTASIARRTTLNQRNRRLQPPTTTAKMATSRRRSAIATATMINHFESLKYPAARSLESITLDPHARFARSIRQMLFSVDSVLPFRLRF